MYQCDIIQRLKQNDHEYVQGATGETRHAFFPFEQKQHLNRRFSARLLLDLFQFEVRFEYLKKENRFILFRKHHHYYKNHYVNDV